MITCMSCLGSPRYGKTGWALIPSRGRDGDITHALVRVEALNRRFRLCQINSDGYVENKAVPHDMYGFRKGYPW